MAFIKEIQTPDNIKHQIKNTIIPVIGTQTSSTSSWTGNIDLPSLYDGLTIAYFLPKVANSGTSVTLNLTLSSGSTTGAINCYYSGNEVRELTKDYDAGSTIIMTYWSSSSIGTSDNRWIVNVSDTRALQSNSTSGKRRPIMLGTEEIGSSETYPTDPVRGKLFKSQNLLFTPSTGTLATTSLNVTNINGVAVGDSPSFTDEKVKQIDSTTNAAYRILFSNSANDNNETDQVKKSSKFLFNPSTGSLTLIGVQSIKSTNIDRDSGTTPASQVSGDGYYNLTDKDGEVVGRIRAYQNTDGGTTVGLYAYTEVTGSTSATNNYILITRNKDGTNSYAVSSPTAFRTAIEAIGGSGNSGYLAKFDGARSLTNGPQLGSSTTTYLRNDGTWTTPANTTYTFATGDNNGQIKVTPSGGSAQNINVKGLGDRAFDSTEYLPLTGGTVTGAINIKSSNLDRDGEAPTSDQTGKSLYFVDKDSNGVGRIYTIQRKTNNKKDLFITVYNASGTSNSIGIRILDDGTPSYYLSYPSAFRAALDNAAYIDANTITNNQVIIADGTDGKLKSSGFTIESSVPSDAVFTDTDTKVNQDNSTSTSYRSLLLGPTTSVTTYDITSKNDITYRNVNLRFKPSEAKLIIGSAEIENVNTSGTQGVLILYDGNDHYCSLKQPQITGNITHTLPITGSELVNLNATQALINKTYNGYTLAAACAKGVTDNSSATAVTSSDTNLITARTLYYAGYTKNTGTVTSIKVGDTSYSPSSGVVSLPDYLKLSGGTLTGSLYVCGTTEKRISLKNSTDNSLEVYMASATNGRHGLYSTGYLNGTTYTQNGKWLVMRDSNGKVYFNGCTIESSVPDDAVFTDEKVKTESYTSTTKQYLIFKSNIDDTNTCYANSNLGYYSKTGTANALGYSQLSLGNSTNQGTANNSYGILRLYPQNGAGSSSYSRLIQKDMSTNSAIFHTLPDTGDELVNLSATQTLTNKTLEDCFFFKTKNTSSDLQHPDILLTEEFVNTDKYSFRLNMTSGQINYQWTRYNGNTDTKKIRDIISIGSNGNITITNDTNTTTPSAEGRKLILGSGSITTSNASGTATTSIVEDYLTSGTISATTTTSTNINVKNFSSTSGDISVQSSLTFANGKNIQMADAIAMQVNKVNNVSQFSLGISTLKLVLYGSSYYLATGSAITSDKRLKTNIEIMDNRYLNLIKDLEPKRFKLKNNPSQKYHTGFIAQDVQELLKKYNINEEEFAAFARPKEDDSEYALSYTEFIPLLLLYIKDLEKQIKEIKEQD